MTPNKWFVRKRGKAAAFLSLMGAASVGFSGFFQILINYFGWRHAYFVLAICFAVVISVINFFMRDSPETMGLLTDGDTAAKSFEM